MPSLLIAMSDFFLRIKSRELWVDWVGDNVFPLLILLYWPSWIGLLLFILGIQFNHNLNKPWWLILLQKLSQQRKHFWSVLLFCQSKHSDFACCEMFAPPVFSLYLGRWKSYQSQNFSAEGEEWRQWSKAISIILSPHIIENQSDHFSTKNKT